MPTRQDDRPPKGVRPFTDREDKIDHFWHLFHRLKEREYNVLSFYGVGGVGKTRLRLELIEQVRSSPWAKETIISSVLDFDTRDNQPSLRDLERALFALRIELHRQGVVFRAFDIAYAHYWEMTHPEVALQQKDIPFINEGSAIVDLFGGGKDLVESLKDFSTWIVGAGMLPKALTLITSLGKVGRDWLTKRAIERLQRLNTLGVGQLLDELVYFLAHDINAYQEEAPDRRFVFFLDTYEALWWEDSKNRSTLNWLKHDQWVRDLIAELPHTLWVIGGRNQLCWDHIEGDNWGEFIDETLMGELSELDSEQYLSGCGLTDQAIINRITFSSRGLPFALELQVDQYERILLTQQPKVDDFTEQSDKLIQRFIEYLQLPEIKTLEILSVTRVWDPPLFLELIRHFQTGYPATALAELSLFSFITREGNQYRMHSLMRDGLRSRLDKKLRVECNEIIFQFYDRKLEKIDLKSINPDQEFAFEEALHHRMGMRNIEEVTDWFFARYINFEQSCRWSLFIRLLSELKEIWQLQINRINTQSFAKILENIGLVYLQQGQYERALEHYQQALRIYQVVLGEQHPDTATLLNDIGSVHLRRGQYELALEYYQQALRIYQVVLGEQHPKTATSLNNIGNVYNQQSRYELALKCHQQALQVRRDVLGEQHLETATSLNDIGTVYLRQGQYELALKCHQPALQIRRDVLGEQHPETATSLNNIGLVYVQQGQYERALEYYQQALRIYQVVLGEQHPDTVTSLSNIGSVHLRQGQYERALEYYQQALLVRQAVLGEQHPRTANSLNNIGLVYDKQSQHELALKYCQQALQIQQAVLGEQHLETATSLNNVGGVYDKQGKYELALEYYQQALSILKIVLGGQHPNIAISLSNIGLIYDKRSKYELALEYYQQALEIRQAALGEQHPVTKITQVKIDEINKILNNI